MAMRVYKKWVIDGGGFKNAVWVVPHVVETDEGLPCVELHMQNSRFPRLFELTQAQLPFFDVVRDLRNKAVDEIIAQQRREENPLGANEGIVDRRGVRLVSLPATTWLELPRVTYRALAAPECKMIVVMELKKHKCASVELSLQNLQYLRVASLAMDADEVDAEFFSSNIVSRKRRREDEKITLNSHHVRISYSRYTLIATWYDADGRSKLRCMRPAAWDEEEIRATEQRLLCWVRLHNHTPDADGIFRKMGRLPPSKDGVAVDESDNENAPIDVDNMQEDVPADGVPLQG